MRGADGLRDVLTELFRIEVPNKVTLLREAWSQTEAQFPLPELITSGEPVDGALDSSHATMINVINPRLLKTDQVDIDPYGLPVNMTRYSCRVYVWVKHPNWEIAMRARDNLAVACRLSLLEWPNCKPGVYGDTGYRLHRNTYGEQFGEPRRLGTVKGAPVKVYAPALLTIDADAEESLRDGSTRTPIGTADAVDHTVNAVGPTQPLPPTS